MDGLIAYALSKKYTDGKTSSIATGMSWKGTKENVSSLPQSGNQVGDLWHVNENGNEYAWDGSKWEALGGIPSIVPEMATNTNMSDWTSGRTVDAATLKTNFTTAVQNLLNIGNAVDTHSGNIIDLQNNKADKTEIPTKTSDLTNDSGFITANQVPSVTVDSALSTTSTNPIQNKAVKAALDGKADASALSGKQDTLTAGQNVTISGNTISAYADSAEIAADVTDWLEENVDPVGSAVVVDSSLSVSGAAADAKVTGDKLSEFIDTSYLTFADDVMENSNFNYNNGTITVTHATAPYNFCAFEVSSISFYWKRPNSSYQLYVGVYDSASNSFIGQNIAAVATNLYKLTGSTGGKFTDFSDLVSAGFSVTDTAVKFVATITGNHFSLTQGDTTILAFTLPSTYTVSGIGFMNYQIANLTEARKNISIKSKIDAFSDEVTALQNSVSNVDIINNGKRHKMIAGVIRNSGGGWEFIVNDQHAGDMNCTGIGTQNGDIKVTYYSATGGKVISVVICPDETLTNQGYTIGTSVAASYFIASIYRRKPNAVSGTVGFSAGAFSVGNNANGVTGVSWDSTNSRLQITHSQITDGTSSVINAQPYRYGTAIPRVYSVSGTSVTLEFVNPASGEKLTEPSNAMEIWFSRSSSTSFASEKIDADTLVSANGNFWFIGIVELPD